MPFLNWVNKAQAQRTTADRKVSTELVCRTAESNALIGRASA